MSSKLPPTGRLISSSFSKDGEKNEVPPPRPVLEKDSSPLHPPPPQPLIVGSSDNNINNQRRNISPPSSVLRMNHRVGGSKNSVAFSDVMDYTNSPSPSSHNNTPNPNAVPTPASIAAASSAASASLAGGQHRRFPASSLTTSSLSSSSRKIITLERVVSSQFENEAETHILAALEMDDVREGGGSEGVGGGHRYNPSQLLLGEGFEGGMDDYSDDEDDHQQPLPQQQQQQQARSRTWSNDSFLKNVTLQNDLPQYQVRLPEQEPQQATSTPQQQLPQPQLRRYISENLPPINENHLAMHIQRENFEEGGGGGGGGDTALFVEAAKPALIVGENILNDVTLNNIKDNGRGVNPADVTDGEDGGKNRSGGPSTITANVVEDVNIMTDATETTENMNFMANRLRSLQQRRGGLQRKRGSLNFNHLGFSSRSNASDDGGFSSSSSASSSSLMGHETSGDKLIDALNSVDSSKNKSFLSKIRSEYTELILPKIPKFQQSIAHVLIYMVIPFLVVAAILFYLFDNPMAGETGTSVSWWIIFLGVRQPIIFELTVVGEVFWVEILALRSKLFNRAVGPYISLAFIQSRGW